MRKRTMWVTSVSVALLAGTLAISPALTAKGDFRMNSARASALMLDARSKALTLQEDVDLLFVAYPRRAAALDDNAIETIRQHIEEAKNVVAAMELATPDAEPWQRDVLTDVAPILKELAGNTNSALQFLDTPNTPLHEDEFVDYLAESDNLAAETARHIAAAVNFGTARNRFYDAYSRFLNALMNEIG